MRVVCKVNGFNYIEERSSTDNNFKGMRCDISYLNFEKANHFIKQRANNLPRDISWIVCKSNKNSKSISSKLKFSSSSPTKARSIVNYNQILFNGTLNAIPNILLDLLCFNPASINIFHADLMVTVDRCDGYHSNTWKKDKDAKKHFLQECARAHDPITQYWILNKLKNNPLIRGDKRFEDVMQLGEQEYMTKLQNIYGNAGRLIFDQT